MQHKPLILLMATYSQRNIFNPQEKKHLDGFLLKPTTPSVLFETINELCHKHGVIKTTTLATQKLTGKILLVEDNTINQQVAKEMLENFNLSVDICENGEDAIKQVKDVDYDLIFMDIQMSGIDGLETTRLIKEQHHDPIPPIIATTAHAMTGDRQRCLDAGMDDYLSKPLDPEVLLQVVTHWLKLPDIELRASLNTPVLIDAHINGINLAKGLSHATYNERLYIQLLRDFLDKYDNSVSLLKHYRDSGSVEEVYSLMHNLCGVAGTIGAEELEKTIFSIIKLLDNNTDNAQLWREFTTRFTELRNNLKSWLNENNQPLSTLNFLSDEPSIILDNRTLARIIQLVENGHTEAAKTLTLIKLQQLTPDARELVSETLIALQKYNFSEALDSLYKLENIISK